MRETPLRRACLPPAGRYYPYANGSLRVRHSLLLTTRRRRRQYTEGKNRLCGVQLSHSYQRPGRSPPNRHNIPRSACRLRTAADRLHGRRSASHRFASASGRGGGGTASTLPGRGAHPPPRVPNLFDIVVQRHAFSVDAHFSEDRIDSTCGERLRIGSRNVSINVDGYVRHR